MKKIILMLLLLVICSSGSFAATKFGIGASTLGFNTALVGLNALPSLRVDIDRTFAVELLVGFNNTSRQNISNAQFVVGSKFKYNFMPSSQFTPHAGGQILFMSDSNPALAANGASSSTLFFGILVGATAYLGKNFAVSADIAPIGYMSATAANVSTTVLGVGLGAISAHYFF